MPAQEPIKDAGEKYVYGLQISKTAAKLLSIAAGAARESENVADIIVPSALVVDGAKVGAGGVDEAVVVLSSWYAVYVIADSRKYAPVAGMLSLKADEPTLPAEYDSYRRIGWVRTDASAEFLGFEQYGAGSDKKYMWEVPVEVLTAGAAAVFTEVDLSTAMPPQRSVVKAQVDYTPALATSAAEFLPFGSAALLGDVVVGTGVAARQRVQVEIPSALDGAVPKLQYKVITGDALTLSISGFWDHLS